MIKKGCKDLSSLVLSLNTGFLNQYIRITWKHVRNVNPYLTPHLPTNLLNQTLQGWDSVPRVLTRLPVILVGDKV